MGSGGGEWPVGRGQWGVASYKATDSASSSPPPSSARDIDIAGGLSSNDRMDTVLWLAGIALLLLFCLLGLLALIVGLPGTFVIVAAATVYAWATDFTTMPWTVPAWLLGLALVAEVLELVAASATASSASEAPSRRVAIAALAGAIVGGIVGTPFLFGIGSLIGAMAGAFAGAALAVGSSGGSWDDSMRIGLAALRGRLFGFVIKAAIAVTMILIVIVSLLR